MQQSTIRVLDICGKYCFLPEEGEALRDEVLKRIAAEEEVFVDFSGIQILTTAFLNMAVGTLYGSLSPEVLEAQFRIQGDCSVDLELIHMVACNAKTFYGVLNVSTSPVEAMKHV